jgi:hypothetical protein
MDGLSLCLSKSGAARHFNRGRRTSVLSHLIIHVYPWVAPIPGRARAAYLR